MSNIAMSPISTGVRYLAVRGIFTDGRDVNVDADDWISPLLLLSMRFDYYAYTLLSDQSRTIARTASLDLNFRFSALWYTALSMDQVWENTRNYQRVYFEAGIHF